VVAFRGRLAIYVADDPSIAQHGNRRRSLGNVLNQAEIVIARDRIREALSCALFVQRSDCAARGLNEKSAGTAPCERQTNTDKKKADPRHPWRVIGLLTGQHPCPTTWPCETAGFAHFRRWRTKAGLQGTFHASWGRNSVGPEWYFLRMHSLTLNRLDRFRGLSLAWAEYHSRTNTVALLARSAYSERRLLSGELGFSKLKKESFANETRTDVGATAAVPSPT